MLFNGFFLFTITSSKILSEIEVLIKQIPWWSYLLMVLLIIVLFFVFPFRKRQTASHSAPITVRTPNIKIVPGNAQHIGSRSEQQDSFGFSDIYDDCSTNQYGVLAVLADGMGGLSGGKEVSHIAVQTFLHHYYCQSPNVSIKDRLIAALYEANSSILTYAEQNGYVGRAGTTLIAAALLKQKLYWVSIGDSRIYLFKNNHLIQLTKDHIYANELDEMAARGEITLEDAHNDPQRASLTSYLGVEEIVELDVSETPINLQRGDSIILCSDGLYGSVTDSEMIEICASLPAQEAAEKLMESALSKHKNNQDNATVAILSIV